MDWALAIERNREPLLRIVAALFAMIGLGEGGAVLRLPRPLHRAALGVLRPAEAAVRRLIAVAARGMAVKPLASRPIPAGLERLRAGGGRVAFQLFDPRERFDRYTGLGRRRRTGPGPRIRVIDFDPRIPWLREPQPIATVPEPDDTVDARRLCRRLAAIKRALDDLPGQARRNARWRAKPLEARRPKRATAFRSGAPPGHRRRPAHAVHAILTDCDWLARAAARADTS